MDGGVPEKSLEIMILGDSEQETPLFFFRE